MMSSSEKGTGKHAGNSVSFFEILQIGVDVALLRREMRPLNNPRRDSRRHIAQLLREAGLDGRRTVGSDVMASITAILALAGEGGGENVHQFFLDPKVAPFYRVPADDPGAANARSVIGNMEHDFWRKRHIENPSPASRIASQYSPSQRAALLGKIGDAVVRMEDLQRHGTDLGDQFSDGVGFDVHRSLFQAAAMKPVPDASVTHVPEIRQHDLTQQSYQTRGARGT